MANGSASINKFRNTSKMTALSYENWLTAKNNGLVDLFVHTNRLGHSLSDVPVGQSFINMSSYSYLGLNRHEHIIEGSISALRDEPITGLAIAPTRMRPSLAKVAEAGLSEIFDATCVIGLSCSVMTAALLPLVSSGHLVDGKPRVTVFDRHAHFCMEMIKPICADEAQVMTAPHNDVSFLEDVCKRENRVAYIADGAYSLGGTTMLKDLRYLQDKYGLFLWFDDSHSLSVVGEKGEGFVRSQFGEMNPLTAISASLNKGFGCSGGVAMLHREFDTSFMNTTSAGPLTWSQNLTTASLGSIVASIEIHDGPELGLLQRDLQRNIEVFDKAFPNARVKTRIVALIETPIGVGNAMAIASASPKLAALAFGAADYSLALGTEMGWELMLPARTTIVMAAKAVGLAVIDSPTFDLQNDLQLEEDCQRAKAMGFTAKFAVHPRQVDTINAHFRPDEAAIEWAAKVMDATSTCRTNITTLDGMMIGPPFVKRAQLILAAKELDR